MDYIVVSSQYPNGLDLTSIHSLTRDEYEPIMTRKNLSSFLGDGWELFSVTENDCYHFYLRRKK